MMLSWCSPRFLQAVLRISVSVNNAESFLQPGLVLQECFFYDATTKNVESIFQSIVLIYGCIYSNSLLAILKLLRNFCLQIFASVTTLFERINFLTVHDLSS